MMKKTLIVASVLMLLATSLAAASSGRWLHVRVDEQGYGDSNVRVNIPLDLVEAILPTIQTDELSNGIIQLDDADLEGIDLPELLRALQDAPDADFVTVKEKDSTVRVSKEGGFLLVNADDDGEKVRVRMPLEVVDALIGSREGEIDLLAGLRALADYGGDLVTVESDDTTVRVWIDSSDSGE